jgi:hypothetical protein
MRDPRISEVVEGLQAVNFPLDGDLAGRGNVTELLAEAGLELWQAPEGFWAVRLKQIEGPSTTRRPRRIR